MIAKTNDKLVSDVGFNLITIGISLNIRTSLRVVSHFGVDFIFSSSLHPGKMLLSGTTVRWLV